MLGWKIWGIVASCSRANERALNEPRRVTNSPGQVASLSRNSCSGQWPGGASGIRGCQGTAAFMPRKPFPFDRVSPAFPVSSPAAPPPAFPGVLNYTKDLEKRIEPFSGQRTSPSSFPGLGRPFTDCYPALMSRGPAKLLRKVLDCPGVFGERFFMEK